MKNMQKALDILSSSADPVPELIHKPGMKPLLFGAYG
jgi:hypothetical protein